MDLRSFINLRLSVGTAAVFIVSMSDLLSFVLKQIAPNVNVSSTLSKIKDVFGRR